MASKFKQRRSPYWYIRFKGAEDQWRKRSTKYRVDDPQETKLAGVEVDEETAREKDNAAALRPQDRWVYST